MWKILSDEKWVMVPNKHDILEWWLMESEWWCQTNMVFLSDEWWVMSDEWWKLSDQKNESKQPLRFNSEVAVLGVFVNYTKINNATKILAYFAINLDALHILM